jgi:hypothetical protein
MPVTVVARAAAEPTFRNLRFIDIAGKHLITPSFEAAHEATTSVNLTDPTYRGYHHGKKRHDGTGPSQN